MNDCPLISILLCTYNGEEFLQEQLDSLLKQTYPNIEIIVSDDASSDKTKSIIENYSKDRRLTVYYQEQNIGYIKNFEFALQKSTGAYICFSDQDDIWLPEKIDTLFKHIGDKWLAYSNSKLIDESGNDLNKQLSDLTAMYSGNNTKGFIFGNTVWGHSMLISRKLLNHLLPFPENIPYDIYIAFKAATLTGIQYVDESLTLYRQHANAVTVPGHLKNKVKTREQSKRYADYIKELNWIKLMRNNVREDELAFYSKLYDLFLLRKNGLFVWPLFGFLMANRKDIFRFREQGFFKRLLEARKMSRGVKTN